MTTLTATAPMLTRAATADDVPRLVAMFQEFVASTQYVRYVGRDPEHCEQAIRQMLSSPDCAVFVVGDDPIVGMVGVFLFMQPFSGEVTASEAFWWLDPLHRGHGGWLLRRAEKWARERGAKRMNMMAPADKPRVGQMYHALGYAEVEHIYQRDL